MKNKKIARIQLITNDDNNRSHAEQAEIACLSGIDWIQVRIKNESDEEVIKQIVGEVRAIGKKYGATIILNDFVEVAKELELDGVHLGQDDMDPSKARKILGNDAIIGGTANDFNQILRMMKSGVDYVGVGPYKYTTSKKKLSPILGLEGYQNIQKRFLIEGIEIPLIAIGGIKVEDLDQLFHAGVYGVAISSAILSNPDPLGKAREFYAETYKSTFELGYHG